MVAGNLAWVLAEDAPERSLGAALIWAQRHHVEGGAVHLLASGSSGALARRAEWFDRDLTVWAIEGATVHLATVDPLPADPVVDPAAASFRALFEEAGADVVAEDGLLRAEILGLEVARVEPDFEGGGVRLAVGVGKHDREAQREVHGVEQGFDHLFEVVRIVAEHRVVDGEGHAAYHLAPERWLRSIVVRRPELVGATSLRAVAPPVAREDLRQAAPAPAAGTGAAGEPLLVVCSVGTDLDLVPSAVDAWMADGRQPRLVICIPEADDYPMTRALIGSLSPTLRAELVTVPSDWRAQ